MPTPTLTFNPITSVELTSSFTILDSAAVVTDGGNALNGINIILGGTTGSLGVVSGGLLSASGTIGLITWQYTDSKRLLTLRDNTGGQTALGAEFTAALRLVAFDRGSSPGGSSRTISINLGRPIYLPSTGHYYDTVNGTITAPNANTSANARTFLGLTGYLTNVTSAAKTAFLNTFFAVEGWIGGNSTGTLTSKPRIWKWGSGPEINTTFWTGDFNDGAAVVGQYTNWRSQNPNNAGFPSDPNNLSPYLRITGANEGASSSWASESPTLTIANYYVEYSTVSGAGDDGLSSTRKTSSMLVNFDPVITSLLQSTTPIQVSLVNGAVTSAIGVPLGSITVGASNATHIQVTIDLGTNNAGKRRQPQGLRVINGSERELVATRTRVGEVYNFVFLKTVDGSNSVILLLN